MRVRSGEEVRRARAIEREGGGGVCAWMGGGAALVRGRRARVVDWTRATSVGSECGACGWEVEGEWEVEASSFGWSGAVVRVRSGEEVRRARAIERRRWWCVCVVGRWCGAGAWSAGAGRGLDGRRV